MKLLMLIFAILLATVLLTGGRAFGDTGVCVSEGDEETCNVTRNGELPIETESEAMEVETAPEMAEGAETAIPVLLLRPNPPPPPPITPTVRDPAPAGKRHENRTRCKKVHRTRPNRKTHKPKPCKAPIAKANKRKATR